MNFYTLFHRSAKKPYTTRGYGMKDFYKTIKNAPNKGVEKSKKGRACCGH
jgi:hypothetical protein